MGTPYFDLTVINPIGARYAKLFNKRLEECGIVKANTTFEVSETNGLFNEKIVHVKWNNSGVMCVYAGLYGLVGCCGGAIITGVGSLYYYRTGLQPRSGFGNLLMEGCEEILRGLKFAYAQGTCVDHAGYVPFINLLQKRGWERVTSFRNTRYQYGSKIDVWVKCLNEDAKIKAA